MKVELNSASSGYDQPRNLLRLLRVEDVAHRVDVEGRGLAGPPTPSRSRSLRAGRKAVEHFQKQLARDAEHGRRLERGRGGRALHLGHQRDLADQRAPPHHPISASIGIPPQQRGRTSPPGQQTPRSASSPDLNSTSPLCRAALGADRQDAQRLARRACRELGTRSKKAMSSSRAMGEMRSCAGALRHELVAAGLRYQDRGLAASFSTFCRSR